MSMLTRRYCIGPGLRLGAAYVAVAALMPSGSAMAQAVQLVKVDVSTVAKGYRVKKILGSTVTNDKQENIGTLDDLVVGEKKEIFAVVQVGGFLGLGGHLVAVPYDTLKITDNGRKIELPGATRDALTALTEFHYAT